MKTVLFKTRNCTGFRIYFHTNVVRTHRVLWLKKKKKKSTTIVYDKLTLKSPRTLKKKKTKKSKSIIRNQHE